MQRRYGVSRAKQVGEMLRYYRRSPLWAPALPLVALFYVGATFASAWRYWRGKGGQWKARVQAPVDR